MKLGRIHKEALLTVKDGADVLSRHLAKTLREVERAHPEYLNIVPPMGNRTVDEKHPFFGVKTTAAGIRWANG